MIYVKARTIGPEGHTPIDPWRRDRLPAGRFRPVDSSDYWQRLASDGDIELRRDAPAEAEIEGYMPTDPVDERQGAVLGLNAAFSTFGEDRAQQLTEEEGEPA